MKIAYFVDEFPPFFRGGLGTYATEISPEFIRKGHSLSVFSRNSATIPHQIPGMVLKFTAHD